MKKEADKQMKKNKKLFKKLVGIERGNKKWKVADTSTTDSEKWIFSLLTADAEAPAIEGARNYRPFIFLAFLALVFSIIIITRLALLQLSQGEINLTLAEGNRIRETVIRAPRGIIYDQNKTKLVQNIPNYEITIIPNDLPKDENEKNSLLAELSAVLKMAPEEINEKLLKQEKDYTQPLLIKENITKDESLIISTKTLQGVTLSVNPTREYLDNGLLAHVFGYVGRINEEELKANKSFYSLTDYIGKTGLEKSYESILRGKDGGKQYEVDSTGKVIKFLGQEEPVLGRSIILGIDFELEKKLAEEMQKQMEKVKATKATAIAMNPNSGEILAYIDLPTYDNNLFSRGISKADYENLLNNPDNPLLPQGIAGEYPSGSSIKPFIAAAALQEGIINESSTINSTGGITVGGLDFPDWKAGGHGITNVVKAIAESVNTFFYALGGGYSNIIGLGSERMKHYLELFGFGQELGLDITGESTGILPDPVWKEKVKNEPWYLGDSYHMAIGQGDVLVTPLQIVNATSAIANGGKLMKPHFVREIVDENDNSVEIKKPEIIRENFISLTNIEIIRRGMRETIRSGSARSLESLSVAIAGKTGTAQFGPNNEKSHGWFTSFAPYDNPTIAMTILVEGSGGGDITAVPIAKEVYQWYFSRD